MLTRYITDTRNLLQNPSAPTTLYDPTNLLLWINKARGQVAGEAECCRVNATILTVINQRSYNFSDISLATPATSGIQGVINVRRMLYVVGDGYQFVPPRPWEWFDLYCLNTPVPEPGPPKTWSQYAQGAAGTGTGSSASGSFFIDPPPDLVYILPLDCTCYPIALTDDTTVEAIPYQWTDAVSFLAAYYALMSAQNGARYGDAERLYSHYETWMQRARTQANPSVNRYMYQQAPDPTLINKLGQQPKAAGTG